jgi:hypothetical protein
MLVYIRTDAIPQIQLDVTEKDIPINIRDAMEAIRLSREMVTFKVFFPRQLESHPPVYPPFTRYPESGACLLTNDEGNNNAERKANLLTNDEGNINAEKRPNGVPGVGLTPDVALFDLLRAVTLLVPKKKTVKFMKEELYKVCGVYK